MASTMYTWTGVDEKGNYVSRPRRIRAISADAARQQLVAQGAFPAKVEKLDQVTLTLSRRERGKKWKVAKRASFIKRLAQLSDMGTSLPAAFEILIKSERDANDKEMLRQMRQQMIAGAPLADVFEAHPRAFDPVTVAYFRASSVEGDLGAVLRRLSALLARNAAIRAQVKQVTTYPKIMGSVIGLIVIALIKFMLPMFEDLYKEFDAKLPAVTQLMMDASGKLMPIEFKHLDSPFAMTVIVPKPLSFLAFVFYFWLAFRALKRYAATHHEAGLRWDRIKFRMPVMGAMWRTMALQQWTSTLTGALKAGVRWDPALALAGEASGSYLHQHYTQKLREGMSGGKQLAPLMETYEGFYPEELVSQVRTGEEVGSVDDMLADYSRLLEEDLDSAVETMRAKVASTVSIAMYSTVMAVVIIIYAPMFKLTTAVLDSVQGGTM